LDEAVGGVGVVGVAVWVVGLGESIEGPFLLSVLRILGMSAIGVWEIEKGEWRGGILLHLARRRVW
jgi:hypothetical protein